MTRKTDPKETARAQAFEMWIKAPMPMVTLFKTIDVTMLVKLSRKGGYKFNMLMCWCIGKAASQTEEFYMLPEDDKMIVYDGIAVSTVVDLGGGGISTCDIPFCDDMGQFSREYLRLTKQVGISGQPYDLSQERMVIGTSALTGYDIDGAVNIYSGVYNNPFLIWGRYRKGLLRTTLRVSFQFHHTQMDGIPAAEFLETVQREINRLNV